ncbi:MFS transporter [Solimonas marina]|uniref:MFS transporter n=1 Tax=Solimonas marina TaxID=2714601 RepID=A0A969W9A0_9GAMM|nr:MFS transporter [Solimonas marina]NKF22259.1 MFS transporter [Solimonas marina]
MPAAPSASYNRLPILALAIAAFAIGTTEFVVMGLLPQIAGDLHVSIPRAGLLVSGYAMGVVIGGPILAVATVRLPRKPALLLLMTIFIVGNLLCAISPSYEVLMVARFVAAFSHGSFFGTAAVVAGFIAPPAQRVRAIALMFAGLTVANVVGVPLGAMIGDSFGWRTTFWIVTALGVLALAGIQRFVPTLDSMPASHLGDEIRVLGKTQVLLALLITIFGFGGVFTLFTYIAPILRDAGLSADAVSAVLVLFGAGATIGMLVGGRVADWKLMPGLIVLLAISIVSYLLFAAGLHHAGIAIVGVFALGITCFLPNAGLQGRAMQQAGDAPLLASTLNQSAFNLGNAGGAFIGSAVLARGFDYPALCYAASTIAAIGIVLVLISQQLEKRTPSVLADAT